MTQEDMEDKIMAFYQGGKSYGRFQLFHDWEEQKSEIQHFDLAFAFLVSNNYLAKTNPNNRNDYYMLGPNHRNYKTQRQKNAAIVEQRIIEDANKIKEEKEKSQEQTDKEAKELEKQKELIEKEEEKIQLQKDRELSRQLATITISLNKKQDKTFVSPFWSNFIAAIAVVVAVFAYFKPSDATQPVQQIQTQLNLIQPQIDSLKMRLKAGFSQDSPQTQRLK